MARTRTALFAWTVVACTPATPTSSGAVESTERPEPASEPADRPAPASETASEKASASQAITIAPRSQMFTTSGAPHHVWFEVTNTSATATIQVVALEIASESTSVPIAITDMILDDVAYPGAMVPIGSGTHVLDFGIDTSKLAPDRSSYTFVLRALVGGREVAVEQTVHRARREPIRR